MDYKALCGKTHRGEHRPDNSPRLVLTDSAMKQDIRSDISFSKVAEKSEGKKADEKPADGSGTQEN